MHKSLAFISFIVIYSTILTVYGITLDNEIDFSYTYNDYSNFEYRETGYPCPNETLIAPCNCSFHNTTLDMTLDCSDIYDEDELRSVLDQEFPSNAFYELYIDHYEVQYESELKNLTSGVFGPNTFQRILFLYTGVENLDEDVFDNMTNELQYLHFKSGDLNIFVMDFSNFTQLDYIELDFNYYLHLLHIISPSITRLYVKYASPFFADLFLNLPNATFIDLSVIYLDDIPDLTSSGNLSYLSLYDNCISSLQKDDLCFSNDLMTIYVDYNKISHMETGSICVPEGGSLHIQNNLITTLDEEVWQPIVLNVSNEGLHLFGNPLTCGCDVEWIFTQNLTQKLDNITRCADYTNFHDMNSTSFESCR